MSIVVSSVLWLATANLARRWIPHRPDPTKQALMLAIGSLAVAFTMMTIPIGGWVSRGVFHVTNLHYLFAHLSALFGAFQFQRLLILLVHVDDDPLVARRHVTYRLYLFGLCAAMMVPIFATSPNLRRVLDTLDPQAPHGLLNWYYGVFLTYGAWTLLDIMRRTRQYATVTPDRWTRRGMQWMSFGAMAGCGYTAYKAVYLAALSHGKQFGSETATATLLAYASALSVTVGCVLPPIGRQASQRRRARRIGEDFEALLPLWSLVTAVSGAAILPVDDSSPFAGNKPFLLSRRMTEITDALSGLGDRFDPAVAAQARRRRAGRPWRPSPDAVDAAVIQAAVAAAQADHPLPPAAGVLPGQKGGLAWMLAVAGRLPSHAGRLPELRSASV